jgi:hypothetical protein
VTVKQCRIIFQCQCALKKDALNISTQAPFNRKQYFFLV